MEKDGAVFNSLRVDGGMVVNDLVVQFLADILGVKVERPKVTETTALGAAFLAGLKVGVYSSLEEITSLWWSDKAFESEMSETQQKSLYHGWLDAVNRVKTKD
jgi:glycerol kinase